MNWRREMDNAALLDCLRRTFHELDRKVIDECPSGCLAVFYFEERLCQPEASPEGNEGVPVALGASGRG